MKKVFLILGVMLALVACTQPEPVVTEPVVTEPAATVSETTTPAAVTVTPEVTTVVTPETAK